MEDYIVGVQGQFRVYGVGFWAWHLRLRAWDLRFTKSRAFGSRSSTTPTLRSAISSSMPWRSEPVIGRAVQTRAKPTSGDVN